ncbi:uncharacterized protein MONOS_2398 [Monocercomonoides exilis]|uniref:uncharacterized protein n=1 Tax=Monocercomonoides exilis TaxID=2049356 RepID=UPI003559F951|nr:hypothetical protein MONOS_2398 [Monocercomonoides exilis]|eukprot:MONOS_2398.1-p1 / transcript=MONOS_2398.1 / gene=MONOS_2398 / organism=Monocercomonoides_exilis_PA203 / gene_product=unspecified product / transcript_product=unspecified product / location=Mono_scaffold00049:77885-78498(+) / protein_length=132 / sequence_SO=supercontig / SO=protein_coding / is_pseudo=false
MADAEKRKEAMKALYDAIYNGAPSTSSSTSSSSPGTISSIPVTEQLGCEDSQPALDDQVQVLSVVLAGAVLNRSVDAAHSAVRAVPDGDDAGAARGAAAAEQTRWDVQSALWCCWGMCRVCSCFTSDGTAE